MSHPRYNWPMLWPAGFGSVATPPMSSGLAGFKIGQLNTSIRFEAKNNSSVLLPALVHDQTVAVGYCVGIPMNSLKGHGVEERMAPAQVE